MFAHPATMRSLARVEPLHYQLMALVPSFETPANNIFFIDHSLMFPLMNHEK